MLKLKVEIKPSINKDKFFCHSKGYCLNYKHITYEKGYNKENQSYKAFWLCILRDLSIYKYFSNMKKILTS